jgi:hypothetical protein
MNNPLVPLVPLLKPLIERAQPEWKKNQQALRRRFTDEVSRAIGEHHSYVSSWCSEAHPVSFAGIPIDAPTVDLVFRSIPRSLGVGGEDLDEIDLLVRSGHVAVLGDPGAGKTTTLRRLAAYVAHEPEVDEADVFKFVLLIVCRDERWDGTQNQLEFIVGQRLGISGKLRDELDNPDSRIREVLDVGALILIDGLDEVPPAYREQLDREIASLGRHLRNAKIVVSCRSADYVAHLPGFEMAEIKPLAPTQIERVVVELLGADDASAFESAISEGARPASDLTNRPLFLAQMIAIFRRRGTIPDRPIDLYDSVTRLILHDWDEQRGVRRVSKYGQFGVDDKRRFLSDLAYALMRRELIRFDERALIDIYSELSERYLLPKNEAKMVARELESHTGLLVNSGSLFEFSHLSLQEFLAADAMVRGGASATNEWWLLSPAVAAVAAAMSSNANDWFSDLVENLPTDFDDNRLMFSFLYRLGQEQPRFIRSSHLGHDLLVLLSKARVTDPDAVVQLARLDPLRKSVGDALLEFDDLKVQAKTTRANWFTTHGTPAGGFTVSTAVLEAIAGRERLRQISRELSKARAEP